MKRFIIILLLLIHTAASSGTVLSMHYCMGSLASMHIGHKEESGCATCGMKNSGCCHDDVKVLKIDNSQFIAANTSHIQAHDQVLLNTSSFCPSFSLFDFSEIIKATPFVYKEGPPLFILNCNFRI